MRTTMLVVSALAACGSNERSEGKQSLTNEPPAKVVASAQPAAPAVGRWHAIKPDHEAIQRWSVAAPCAGQFTFDIKHETPCGELKRWAYEGRVEGNSLGVRLFGTDTIEVKAREEKEGRCSLALFATTPDEKIDVTFTIAAGKIEGGGTYSVPECKSQFTLSGQEDPSPRPDL